MLHVFVNFICMQLHRLHKYPTYAYPVFTKAFEMRYPVLKVKYSPYAQLLPWQLTLYVSLILSKIFAPLIVLRVRSNLTLL